MTYGRASVREGQRFGMKLFGHRLLRKRLRSLAFTCFWNWSAWKTHHLSWLEGYTPWNWISIKKNTWKYVGKSGGKRTGTRVSWRKNCERPIRVWSPAFRSLKPVRVSKIMLISFNNLRALSQELLSLLHFALDDFEYSYGCIANAVLVHSLSKLIKSMRKSVITPLGHTIWPRSWEFHGTNSMVKSSGQKH